MNLEATKHVISDRTTFCIYGIITLYNVHLDDDRFMDVIRMLSIVVEIIMKGKIKMICIKIFPYVQVANILAICE